MLAAPAGAGSPGRRTRPRLHTTPPVPMITVWLIGICFVLIAVINWFLFRWTQNMIRREKRISEERGELVNFLNRVVHSVTTITAPEEWLETLTAELVKTMNSQGIWVYFETRTGSLRLA